MGNNFVSSEADKISNARSLMMQQRLNAPDGPTRSQDTLCEPEPPAEPEARDAITRLPGIATQLIGERMRTMYASMVREPVPDDLLNLIRQLEAKEASE
jgi:hypothetical protein